MGGKSLVNLKLKKGQSAPIKERTIFYDFMFFNIHKCFFPFLLCTFLFEIQEYSEEANWKREVGKQDGT